MINNKIHKYKLSLLKETFLTELTDNSLSIETKSCLLETFEKRIS